MFKPSFICKTLSQFQRGTRTSYTYSAFKLSRWGAKKAGITTLCAVGTLFGTSYFVLYGASNDEDKKKKLVILGSGWGAVSLLKFLDSNKYDVSVISPENYFLLTPLLPGVTVGTVEGRSIIEPIRKYLSKSHKEDTTFYEAECTHVDVEKNQVVCKDLSKITGLKEEFTLDYDYLVVAIGAQTATYNIKGVAEHTHFLKTVKQAQTIRKNILDSFETAALPGQPDYEQRRLLHFVVVGGGPTGVEFAAELRDYVKHDLSKYYPKDLIDKSKITLVDGLNKILNTYSEEISRYASSRFKNEGIDIVTNTFVTNVEKNTMHLLDSKTKEKSQMAYGMCVWCAGISPRDLTKQLINDIPGQTNRFALITDGHFKVNNTRNIFAVGDCSTIQNDEFISIIEQIIQRNDEKATLTTEQIQGFLDDSMKKFPKFCHQFKRMKRDLDNDPQESLTIQALRKLASKTLTQETALPPTAQVAAQEGKYLGKLLSNYKYEIGEKDCSDIPIFTYRHLGSFAYVGDNHAVLEFPVVGSLMGWSSMWLWRGTYANECVSYRMRALVVLDWIKSYIFGRDTSRI